MVQPMETVETAQPESMSLGDVVDSLEGLVTQAIVLIAMFFLYRSVPKSVMDKWLDEAGEVAEATPTPIDDVIVDIGKAINDSRPDDSVNEEIAAA